ncbi:hypothetical protein Tco_1573181, partial [Tanacetum coccineum]
AAKICTPYWKPPIFYDDDDEDDEESCVPLKDIIFELPLSIAITPDFPIMDSLIMEDEHLDTILETKSNEENDDDESFSDEDVPKENFKIYSNPLFDEEIISTKIDPHHFNAESNFIESLLNRDTLIISSPKFDSLLEEFSSKLAHIDLIPPGINGADFDPEEEIRLVEKLLYDNSSPRPPKEFNSENPDAIIESFSPSPIPVEDIDSLIEEIDLFLTPDDSMPPDIENDDYDSERDILFLEELLRNDSPSLELYVHVPSVLPNLPTLSPMFDTLLPFLSENEDKAHLLSHRGFKDFQVVFDFSESPMMIYGEDIPILDVPFLYFYPP